MEFLLYGLRRGETERYMEVLLATRPTKEAAESVIEIATREGFHSFRIATFDGSPPDFVGALKRKRS
jgi:hypothetical protein